VRRSTPPRPFLAVANNEPQTACLCANYHAIPHTVPTSTFVKTFVAETTRKHGRCIQPHCPQRSNVTNHFLRFNSVEAMANVSMAKGLSGTSSVCFAI